MAPGVQKIIVDNASTDRTLELVRDQPGIKVIGNRENRGFAAAVNQGVRGTDADFLLLLNPDVQILTAVDELVAASRQHGLAAGQLVDNLAGREGPQRGFTLRRFPSPAALIFELFGLNRVWPSNPVNRKYRYLDRDLAQPGPVEQPAGAFLMFRRDVWERLHGFDEDFFPVWFEDVDFCRRAAAAGYRVEYVPSVKARHQGGHSVGQLSEGCRARYWCVSLLTYAFKHFRPLAYRAVCLAVVLSSVPRMVAGMIRQRDLSPLTSWIRIVGFAGGRLLCLRSSCPRGS